MTTQTTTKRQTVCNEAFNARICYIKAIFQKYKYIGTEQALLKNNPYYYNDMFDKLYAMDIDQLIQRDIDLHNVCAFQLTELQEAGHE